MHLFENATVKMHAEHYSNENWIALMTLADVGTFWRISMSHIDGNGEKNSKIASRHERVEIIGN